MEISEMKVGETLRMKAKPPLTWWDMLLWRLFRMERKRPEVWQTFVVTDVTKADAPTSGWEFRSGTMTAQESAKPAPLS